ncbi:MAG: hypothetical protein M1816_001282 [Peltula sp. TS41687]|nr:MAG: hypothetical protein M1816_001282 [Peltula sp. TS41687]
MRFSLLFSLSFSLCLGAAAPNDLLGKYAAGHHKDGCCEKLRTVPYLSDVAQTPFGQYFQAARVGDGTTYRYVHIRPRHRNHPYILFVHGFPSSAYDWRNQITYFAHKGYGIIAPDLLGYGGTDKPNDPEAYHFKKMSEEIIAILDCEGIKTVHGVGHDWGSSMLSRMANYFPSRFRSYAFLDVGYLDPSTHLDRPQIELINNQTRASLGYPVFGYWAFFTAPEGAPIIDSHTAVLADSPLPQWLTEEERRIHSQIFSHGGYTPALNWYKVRYFGLDNADDDGMSIYPLLATHPNLFLALPFSKRTLLKPFIAIPKARALLTHPVLLITAANDPVVPPSSAEAATRPFAPDLRTEQVEAAHWLQLEKKDEVNAILESFFKELRVINGFFKHITLRRSRLPSPNTTTIGPEALFRPIITSTYAPLLECDYNLHKSNSTYFSDLDISRMHLLSCLLSRGITKPRPPKNDAEPQGRISIILGGVSCSFRREIKPYERYEIWSRLLTWDRKWVYIVSHFVERDAVRPKRYIFNDGGRRRGWLGFFRGKSTSRNSSRGKNMEVKQGHTSSNGTVSSTQPYHPAIYASALSKYVVKKGRLTIPPERVFEISGLLPPKPASSTAASSEERSPFSSPGSGMQNATTRSASLEKEVTVDTLLDSTISPKQDEVQPDSEELSWTWERVEEERQRGMKLADLLAGMDSTHSAFTGAEELALGEFGDLF